MRDTTARFTKTAIAKTTPKIPNRASFTPSKVLNTEAMPSEENHS